MRRFDAVSAHCAATAAATAAAAEAAAASLKLSSFSVQLRIPRLSSRT